jgi:MOSC domain-containing protein YiiM
VLSLAELTARYAQPGRVEGILIRPVRLEAPVFVDQVACGLDGLAGDHSRPGKRAVTLIQAEHLPVIAALAGLDQVSAEQLRRNLIVSGLNLSAWRGKSLLVGDAILKLTVPCAPCSRMETTLGHGAYNAMRGHGGWCAEVMQAGQIQIGDQIVPARD